MFAIIETGGKQYKVSEGTIVDVEKLETENITEVSLDKVLLLSTDQEVLLGKPYLEKVSVVATILEPLVKDDKIIVFKYKRKTGYRKTKGHRQKYTRIRVKEIVKE